MDVNLVPISLIQDSFVALLKVKSEFGHGLPTGPNRQTSGN